MSDQPEQSAETAGDGAERELDREGGGAEIVAFPESRRDVGLRDVIGEVLRDERKHQERTLADVAQEAAVSVQYLSEVERGRKDVSSDLLEAMYGALGLDLAEVLERATDRLRIEACRGGSMLLAA
jgi:hypothetical protein